jgi:hypothetical protein
MLLDPVEALQKTVDLLRRTGFSKPIAAAETAARFGIEL